MRHGFDWETHHFTEEDYNKVLVETTKVIEAEEDWLEVALSLCERGIVYAKRREYAKAIADYTYAIQIYPVFAATFYNRGLSYWKLERYDEALEDFNQAICLYSDIDSIISDKRIQRIIKSINKMLIEKNA